MTDAVTALLRVSGLAAIALLFCTLAVSPLRPLLAPVGGGGSVSVPRIRRALGIACACTALAHSALALALFVRVPFAQLLDWPFLRAGVIAVLVLSALLVTSFPALVRALRLRAWRELHRLAYVALFFALQHLALAPFGSRTLVVGLVGLAGLLFGVRVLAWVTLLRSGR